MISTAFKQIGRSKVTIATQSAESGMHSLRAVKMVLRALPPRGIRVTSNDWEEVNLCVLFCIICMYSLHSAIPIGVWESGSGISHHAAQSVSPRVAGLEPGGGELSDGEKQDGVYSCMFPVGKGRIFTSAPLRILTLS